MPRKRNPRLEKQRKSQERTRERNGAVGVPESCHIDHAISAALYIHTRACAEERIADPTISRLLSLARDIMADAKKDDGTQKFDRDICDERVRHRAMVRKVSDRKRYERVHTDLIRRKLQREMADVPF